MNFRRLGLAAMLAACTLMSTACMIVPLPGWGGHHGHGGRHRGYGQLGPAHTTANPIAAALASPYHA